MKVNDNNRRANHRLRFGSTKVHGIVLTLEDFGPIGLVIFLIVSFLPVVLMFSIILSSWESFDLANGLLMVEGKSWWGGKVRHKEISTSQIERVEVRVRQTPGRYRPIWLHELEFIGKDKTVLLRSRSVWNAEEYKNRLNVELARGIEGEFHAWALSLLEQEWRPLMICFFVSFFCTCEICRQTYTRHRAKPKPLPAVTPAEVLLGMSYYISNTMSICSDPYALPYLL